MEFKTLKQIFKHMFNFVLLWGASFSAMANVVLVDGQVRAMPPSVPNSAAYLTLENHGPSIKLIAVEANFVKEAQLHTVIEEDGMVKMRQVESFTIPQHGNLTLSESGKHIMLLGLKQPLVSGESVNLILKFDNGSELPVSLKVSKQAMAKSEGHHHHH
ncbi:copper chaperone PCu(A)C [Shewanella psychrophila]|uniref:copper chaperone PCu(A)C n=1 Tax=Shewanella psychrophila TaxID=225848 RepID=UPI00098AE0F2|nr:copper chaperone PCu(A)C [Shewanella psychrophila]